jgi:hypothetical protein
MAATIDSHRKIFLRLSLAELNICRGHEDIGLHMKGNQGWRCALSKSHLFRATVRDLWRHDHLVNIDDNVIHNLTRTLIDKLSEYFLESHAFRASNPIETAVGLAISNGVRGTDFLSPSALKPTGFSRSSRFAASNAREDSRPLADSSESAVSHPCSPSRQHPNSEDHIASKLPRQSAKLTLSAAMKPSSDNARSNPIADSGHFPGSDLRESSHFSLSRTANPSDSLGASISARQSAGLSASMGFRKSSGIRRTTIIEESDHIVNCESGPVIESAGSSESPRNHVLSMLHALEVKQSSAIDSSALLDRSLAVEISRAFERSLAGVGSSKLEPSHSYSASAYFPISCRESASSGLRESGRFRLSDFEVNSEDNSRSSEVTMTLTVCDSTDFGQSKLFPISRDTSQSVHVDSEHLQISIVMSQSFAFVVSDVAAMLTLIRDLSVIRFQIACRGRTLLVIPRALSCRAQARIRKPC